jgi:glutathione synthase/RimK-type ligase-like ATP-grasp enzyme
VVDFEGLQEKAAQLFKTSVLIIAQEFMYTEFDWRIGVLGGEPLFACRYYMADQHWQIYNHAAHRVGHRTGGSDTMPIAAAPARVVQLAKKASGLIGGGLYGVDIKQNGDHFVVIEINDNPNIDAGIEDRYLGQRLYQQVIEYFLRQVETRRYRGAG